MTYEFGTVAGQCLHFRDCPASFETGEWVYTLSSYKKDETRGNQFKIRKDQVRDTPLFQNTRQFDNQIRYAQAH